MSAALNHSKSTTSMLKSFQRVFVSLIVVDVVEFQVYSTEVLPQIFVTSDLLEVLQVHAYLTGL